MHGKDIPEIEISETQEQQAYIDERDEPPKKQRRSPVVSQTPADEELPDLIEEHMRMEVELHSPRNSTDSVVE